MIAMKGGGRSGPLVVVGDTLLDRDLVGRVERLSPDAPVPVVDEPEQRSRPGGAGLAAVLARRDGRDVVLVTALAADAGGAELRALLAAEAVRVVDLTLDGATPEKVRVRADGRSLLRLDRGGPGGPVGPLPEEARRALAQAGAVLVADYGRGVAATLDTLPERAPVVWDPHPRGVPPLRGVTLGTPNAKEAELFVDLSGAAVARATAASDNSAGGRGAPGLARDTAHARALRARWGVGAVAVTLGARGALLVSDEESAPLVVPAPQVPCFDPCGAGDRFASAAAGLLLDGALPSEAVTGAVAAASAFVGAGGAAAVLTTPTPAAGGDVVAGVRAAGGTVVATGGCFDLLHAGHVSVLRAARSLGDCLVVLLNSDTSVRGLKGDARPLVPQEDRAAVLRALECVDDVVVFDEETPVAALERLRPDVWAKGGDYALADLPEAEVVARWGGQAVVLPYLAGRSTTSMIQEMAKRV
jgi:rfaE bifunctional protein nucleotidyltransferase chain/domain